MKHPDHYFAPGTIDSARSPGAKRRKRMARALLCLLALYLALAALDAAGLTTLLV